LIYNGTNRPEVLVFEAKELQTSLTYTFNLYAMNEIFLSPASDSLVIKIGVVPSKPGLPQYIVQEYESGSITITWAAPTSTGGWPILSYLIWTDNGDGIGLSSPITVLAS